jgi:glycosyltransferase involved in cell wall biosynthesis
VGREAVLLSFRLGGTDGVSVEAAKWAGALTGRGFSVRRVAGELSNGLGPDDIVLPWLSVGRTGSPPEPDRLAAALDGARLVVVENLCSLPLNLSASRAAARVIVTHHGRVLFHHHDLPWQRPELAHITDLPPDLPGALHVTINDRSRRELAARGIGAVTIRNAFDVDAPPGDRERTRSAFGFADDDLVVLQPTRAIPRKDVPAGIRFVEGLVPLVGQPVRFWLTGPAEDGYEPDLERLVATAAVPVTTGRAPSAADAYAAADAVVLPSTWEGFGNPVIESVIARRPLAVAPYPVLDEIASFGFSFFPIDDAVPLAGFVRAPDAELLEANRTVARRHFSLADLPIRLERAFATAGWSSW